MIQLIDVCKTYRVKKGPEVKALDHVNLTFGEKGLVFILGKSGAGKSTLLNVVGGLDRIDSGDIVIMGKSSKDFSQAEFDSYRNTYLGFIFQEYNILPDFTIGQNIALALQLQGQKGTNEEVDAILDQVDLHGLRDRKPNELSGGQKQRVAIARALIKKPQIIMADEPTGALDSKTGQDIFNTLKKLAETHLVICVSHDRDFAESFGDRVIEMKDGKVLSDITKSYVDTQKVAVGVEVLSPRLLSFQKGHVLTEEDVTLLNKYLAAADHEMLVSSDDAINTSVKTSAKIDNSGKKGTFNETTPESVGAKEYKESEFALKKSRLPFARSMKMAATSLRSKPFRLIATIILTIVSFGMTGISASSLTYRPEAAFVETAQGLDMDSLTVSKYYSQSGLNHYFSQDDFAALSEESGLKFGANPRFYNLTYKSSSDTTTVSARTVSTQIGPAQVADSTGMIKEPEYTYLYSYLNTNSAFVLDGQEASLKTNFGSHLSQGVYPTKDNQIAITDYYYGFFQKFGMRTQEYGSYQTANGVDENGNTIYVTNTGLHDVQYTAEELSTPAKFLALAPVLTLVNYPNDGSGNFTSDSYTITAIVDSGTDYFTKYGALDAIKTHSQSELSQENQILYNNYTDLMQNSYLNAFYGAVGFQKRMADFSGVTFTSSSKLFEKSRAVVDSKDTAELKKLYGFLAKNKCFDFNDYKSKVYLFSDTVTVHNKDLSYSPTAISSFSSMDYMVGSLRNVLFWTGFALACFAGLLLATFIASSITYQKRQIGILRALGARGTDVYLIFWNESMMIALASSFVSVILTIVLDRVISNSLMSAMTMATSLFRFDAVVLAILLGLSVVAATAASFIPCLLISKKKPIDSINER